MEKRLGLYIHIPICLRKCAYCDFYSTTDTNCRVSYVRALIEQIRSFDIPAKDYIVDSIYIGGGTPSLLWGEDLEDILYAVRSKFRLSHDVEISMEANPGTLDGEKLASYRSAGVNRLSIGLQSADNEELQKLSRIHTKEEFESVIMTYFNIDSETLQSKTVYYSEDSTYEYKPRGFEEVEYPEYPYSEVVGFTENSDGTITLTANVVFPYAGDSKVYAHEVVVRPLEDGGVQYVSNRIIPSEDNYRETWHTPRLTLEEWEELYGGE